MGNEDRQIEPMNILHRSLYSQVISEHQFDTVSGVGHNVGELYNREGIEGLRFHADCFDNSDPIQFYPNYLPNVGRFYIPC